MVYDIGDLARLSVAFTDLDGVPADPTTVTLTVQAPDNTQSSPIPTHTITGAWHYDLPITQSGVYFYRYSGSGLITAVEEGQITVRESILVPQPVDPPLPVTSWTAADLAVLMEAIKTGAKEVRFQDRTVVYHSLEEMLRLRDLMLIELSSTAYPIVRQIRMSTHRGW